VLSATFRCDYTTGAAEPHDRRPRLCGIAVGYLAIRRLDQHAVEVTIALITLAFTGLWFVGGGKPEEHPRSVPKAVLAGISSGFTTMVANAGGPPLAMYLLPLGLPKAVYAGTTSLFFTVGNLIKVGPWLALSRPGPEVSTP